jgi:hypothetical protein
MVNYDYISIVIERPYSLIDRLLNVCCCWCCYNLCLSFFPFFQFTVLASGVEWASAGQTNASSWCQVKCWWWVNQLHYYYPTAISLSCAACFFIIIITLFCLPFYALPRKSEIEYHALHPDLLDANRRLLLFFASLLLLLLFLPRSSPISSLTLFYSFSMWSVFCVFKELDVIHFEMRVELEIDGCKVGKYMRVVRGRSWRWWREDAKLVDLTVVESQKSQLKRTSSQGRRALLSSSSFVHTKSSLSFVVMVVSARK